MKPFTKIHAFFYVLSWIFLIGGGIAFLLGLVLFIRSNIMEYEDLAEIITMIVGGACVLLFPFVYSWGQLIEDVHNIATKNVIIGKDDKATETILKKDLPEI